MEVFAYYHQALPTTYKYYISKNVTFCINTCIHIRRETLEMSLSLYNTECWESNCGSLGCDKVKICLYFTSFLYKVESEPALCVREFISPCVRVFGQLLNEFS